MPMTRTDIAAYALAAIQAIESPQGTVALNREARERAARAVRVAWCESRGDVNARNARPVSGCNGPGDMHATGLFQIVPGCHPQFDPASLRTAGGATAAAYKISNGFRDWGPWACPNTPTAADREAVDKAVQIDQGPGGLAPYIEDIQGAASDAVDAAGDVVEALPDPLEAIGNVLEFYADPHNYLRAGMFVGGLLLLAVGGWMIVQGVASKVVAPAVLGTVAGSPTTP